MGEVAGMVPKVSWMSYEVFRSFCDQGQWNVVCEMVSFPVLLSFWG